MQKKSTPKIDIRASGRGPLSEETFSALFEKVSQISEITLEASYIVEIALEQMVDNGLLDPEKDESTIYFPVRERDKLRFLCDDVGRRIQTLNDLAESATSLLQTINPYLTVQNAGVSHERSEAQH